MGGPVLVRAGRARVAAALVAAASCAPEPPRAAPGGAPPRVLLVTWDTTRADRIGCYGREQARTPGLDELAARGVRYANAWTVAPITLPAHATILTGVLPCAHGVRDNGIFQVGAEASLLSEVLQRAGWRTAAFVGSFILDGKFGLAQGFDVYDAPDASSVGVGWSVIERPAPAVADAALAFIDTLSAADRFFLWVHFYDPHSPHEVPPGFAQPGEDDYDAEIALCDRELRRILERLRARRLDDGLLTIVTADHGESLGDHGEPTHGHFVYDSTMRVPLVVSPPPPGTPPGTTVRAPVSTADLAPTVLERIGLARALLPDARSLLLPAGDGDEAGVDGDRPIYLETYLPFHEHRWHPLRGLIWKGFKYVEAPRPELYELASDAGETRNLFAERSELAQRLAARLRALAEEHAPLGWGVKGALTMEDQHKLLAFGYTGGAADGDPDDPTLPDPKDRVGDLAVADEIQVLMHAANEALGLGQGLRTGRRPEIPPERRARGEALLAQARARIEALREAHPRDPYIDHIDATIELDLGNYAAAVAPLERLAVATPRNMPVRYNLAVAYAGSQKPDWARREMEKALFVEPRSLAAHRWLLQFSVSRRDWEAAAHWSAELAACPGQSERDLAAGRSDRQRILAELAKSGGAPRPPAPVTEADLAPEGLR